MCPKTVIEKRAIHKLSNLSTMYRPLSHFWTDSCNICLGISNFLPKLSSRAISFIYLSSVYFETLLFKLIQHPIFFRLRFPNFMPYYLVSENKRRQTIRITPKFTRYTLKLQKKLVCTWSSWRSDPHVVSACGRGWSLWGLCILEHLYQLKRKIVLENFA